MAVKMLNLRAVMQPALAMIRAMTAGASTTPSNPTSRKLARIIGEFGQPELDEIVPLVVGIVNKHEEKTLELIERVIAEYRR